MWYIRPGPNFLGFEGRKQFKYPKTCKGIPKLLFHFYGTLLKMFLSLFSLSPAQLGPTEIRIYIKSWLMPRKILAT